MDDRKQFVDRWWIHSSLIKMQKAYIKAISYYLPQEILTNEGLVKDFPEWTVEKIASKIGVVKRHVSGSETALDMAFKASEALINENEISRDTIDFILLCTQSPDYKLPSSSCILQDKLGLKKTCGALDYNLGCSGYVYGLSLAKGLIAGGIAKNILLLTSETYTKYIHPKDKGNRTIFGDAATASLISDNGFAEIMDFELGTDGSGAENLIVKTGGARFPNVKNEISFDESGVFVSSDNLYMNGGEIFNFTSDMVPVMVSKVLEKNKLKDKDVSLYIFHQANKYMINYLRKIIGIDKERFYEYMQNVGNTVSSSIPIAMKEAQKSGVLKGNVLLAGFGVGYSYGGVILNVK